MPEYIEREAVVERINNSIRSWSRDYNSNAPRMVSAYKDVLFRIQSVPTADVAEVKHGVWNLYFDGKELMCSVCKATFWDECGNGGTNYCPNCGAKMDGGKNGK